MKHYIALDWAQRNMAISRMTEGSNEIRTIDVKADVKEFRQYLKQLKGEKVLTFEETTTSQWLYTEFKDYVDEVIVCDPYRNKLLSEGAKTDKNDAEKLVQLLKANLLKPVFHSADEFISLRKLVSGYQDMVVALVRLKNQRSAILRGVGKAKKEKESGSVHGDFVIARLDRSIEFLEEQRKEYKEEFAKLHKKHSAIRLLRTIPGIGPIGAVKLTAIVVQAERFKESSNFLSYCGLVELQKISGGIVYGRRAPRCCRTLKHVFMAAAMIAIRNEGPLKNYYSYLIANGKIDSHARKSVARKIAVITLSVMKSKKPFDPGRFKCSSK